MTWTKSKRITIVLVLVLINIGLDQVTKIIARNNLDYNQPIELMGQLLVLTKVENTGAFLSLGSDFPPLAKNLLLLGLPALVLLVMLFVALFRKSLTHTFIIGIAFVLGGGMSNTFDRIIFGSVTDFLFMDFGIFHTGVFNLADLSIMVGIGIILSHSFYTGYQEKKKQKELDQSNEAASTQSS